VAPVSMVRQAACTEQARPSQSPTAQKHSLAGRHLFQLAGLSSEARVLRVRISLTLPVPFAAVLFAGFSLPPAGVGSGSVHHHLTSPSPRPPSFPFTILCCHSVVSFSSPFTVNSGTGSDVRLSHISPFLSACFFALITSHPSTGLDSEPLPCRFFRPSCGQRLCDRVTCHILPHNRPYSSKHSSFVRAIIAAQYPKTSATTFIVIQILFASSQYSDGLYNQLSVSREHVTSICSPISKSLATRLAGRFG
jgi:hypothetical protein